MEIGPVLESPMVQSAADNCKMHIWKEFHPGSYKKQLETFTLGTINLSVLGSDLFNCGINVLAKALFIAREKKPLKGKFIVRLNGLSSGLPRKKIINVHSGLD